MKKRNVYSLGLVGLLGLSLIACSPKSSSSAGTSTSGSTGSSSGTGPKRASITVEIFDRGTDGGKSDPTNNEWTKWIKEKVLKDENIDVTFIRVPRADEIAALNNLMAAGNPPDVCLTYSGELIGNYRDLGGLFDMAPHVDTLLADLKKFLGPDQALPGRDFIRRNEDLQTGKLFSISARRMNTAMRNIFIRKDWLDKLGLPLPKTTEEFYNALAAFRDQDPGGVGKNNVIPFSMTSDVRWPAGNILDAFIDPALTPKERWINTVVDRNFLIPGYKEGVRFLNKMYNDGLIDRNFPLYKADDDMMNLVKSGFIGAICHNWDQIYRTDLAILTDLQKNVPGAELVPVDAMTSSDGITHKSAYDAAGINFFIPASCKNPEAALRYINWLARFENYNFLQIGPEGVAHDVVDGVPKIKAASGLWIQNSAQNLDYTFHINGLDLGNPELNARALANAYPWPSEVIANAYKISTTNAAPGPVVPVTLSAAGPVTQVLTDKGSSIFSTCITAAADFDRIWDAGIADWLASGAQSVIDERRAKYPW
ncbi:MAG: extracellular solute-binding protein [Treponema sp.]|jgi:putative aldouronate transport system substrate-binding protein|nr:extracellular solute-binding protein [Treponema sp.]